MKTWALILNGIVVELIDLSETLVPGKDVYTPAVAAQMVDVTSVANIQVGWVETSGAFTAPPTFTAPALTQAQLLNFASAKQNSVLAQVWTFNVGTSSAPVNLTTKLDSSGSNNVNKIASWCLLNASNSGATIPWSNVDFTPYTLTLAQAQSLVTQAGDAELSTYATLNTVAAAIKATPPTITAKAQIDAAAWPVP